MQRIIIASENPVKKEAVLIGFHQMFPEETFMLDSIRVGSGVSDQPLTDHETMCGALNRAKSAQERMPGANYWVGVEGGVDHLDGEMIGFAWVVILSKEQMGKARTGIFILPPEISALIDSGKELGEADDIVFGKQNSKQANGAVGLLTNDALTRATFYSQAVILALIPIKNPALYRLR